MNKFIIILFCLASVISVQCQSSYVKEATKLLQNKRYEDALNLITIDPIYKKSVDFLMIGGISKYHISQYKEAIEDLNQAVSLGGTNPLIFKYLGHSLYALGNYEGAANYYKAFLSGVDSKHPDFHYIKNEIYRCEKNILFKNQEEYGFVDNLGKVVNTSYNEIRPVQSPNYLNKFYFSSNRTGATGGPRNKFGIRDEKYGHHLYDMYCVEQDDGNWTPSYIFNDNQNTSKNEILQSFNGEGNQVFFLKSESSDLVKADLMTDIFSSDFDEKEPPSRVVTTIRSDLGDKDIFVYNDSLYLFSSKRKGGYGGYDIYSTQMINGVWQNPINLGPQINSAYDEVAPFLTKGSKLLFFSSNRLEGYGGFDLHFSTYNISNASWQQPNNLGASINSPMDDIDLFISSDGVFGMFASNRNGGYGGFDIYQVFFSEQIIDQLEYTDLAFFTNTTSSSNSGAIDNATFYDIDKSINSINLPRREYLNSPMFYNEKNINTIAISFIKNIQDLMLIYQNLELTIIVSRGFDQNREVSLYQSIKTGVNIANEIIKNTNIKSSRINVVGLGSNMPIVSLESPSSERMNNRIEFIFTADNLPELKIIEDPSIINNYIIGDGYYTLQLFKTRLSYTVPFATTAQMLRTDLVKTDPRTIISKNLAENNYTYSLAFFKSYQDARLQKNELLKKNLLNARVLPFINGVNIPTYKLDFYLEKFEDLSEYKKYEILE